MSNGTHGSGAVCELGVTCLQAQNAPKSTEWGEALGCGRALLAGCVNVSTNIQPNIFHLLRNSLKYLWELFLVSSHLSKSL